MNRRQYSTKPGPWTLASYFRGIGDDLMLTALARELRLQGRATRVTVVTFFPELFTHNPHIDHVRRSNRWRPLRRLCFEVLLRLSRAGHLPRTFLPSYPHPLLDRHPVVHQLDELCLRSDGARRNTEILLTDDEHTTARKLLGKGRWVAMHSTGRVSFTANKTWGPERFAVLCSKLRTRGLKVVQLGMPSDPPLAADLDLRGGTALREAAAVIDAAAVSVFQEGGLSHMSNAVDTPCVVICGGYSGPNWLYADQSYVGSDLPCAPCNDPLPCPLGLPCMAQITPDAVAAHVDERLNETA